MVAVPLRPTGTYLPASHDDSGERHSEQTRNQSCGPRGHSCHGLSVNGVPPGDPCDEPGFACCLGNGEGTREEGGMRWNRSLNMLLKRPVPGSRAQEAQLMALLQEPLKLGWPVGGLRSPEIPVAEAVGAAAASGAERQAPHPHLPSTRLP